MTENNKKFPTYVKIHETALHHSGNGIYYRDAGRWSVKTHFENEKLIVKDDNSKVDHLNGVEVIECTCEEWQEDNLGYV